MPERLDAQRLAAAVETLPPDAVLGVYARENGKGMLFPDEGSTPSDPPKPDAPAPGGRPSLKVVK